MAAKLSAILIFTILLKFIEQGRNIVSHADNNYKIGTNILYNIFYLHLPMSMGAVGICFDIFKKGTVCRQSILYFLIIIMLTLLGCFFRGIISKHTPETTSFTDPDWFFGVVLPNVLGFLSLIISVTIITS